MVSSKKVDNIIFFYKYKNLLVGRRDYYSLNEGNFKN